MNPKVSVIIPVYNTEQYLAECLNSVIFQTLKEIEIIVINDASPDNAIGIVHDYQKNDDRIVLLDKQNNEGVGKARNDGIKVAKGEFVIFMDSDDLYSSDKALEFLYNAAVKNHVKVAGGRRDLMSDDGTIKPYDNPFTEYGLTFKQNGLMKYSDFQYDYGYTCYLINREMIVSNCIEFPFYSRFQDPPFFVRAMAVAGEYFFIDELVYRYRLLPVSSKCTLKKTIDMLSGIIDNLRFSRENDLPKLHCLSAHRLNTEGSFMAIQNLYDKDNRKLLSKVIEATNAVDVKWLNENGFEFPDPFVPDVFQHTVETAAKYEQLRNKGLIKLLRKIVRR